MEAPPIPSVASAAATQAGSAQPSASSAQGAQMTQQPSSPTAKDDLDVLFEQYAQEAAAAKQAVESAPRQERQQPPSQKGMAQLREEGLAAALPASNKGYQLLAAMGYREGQGLGARAAGRVEPLAVDLRPVRQGLGRPEQQARRKAQAQAQRAQQEVKRARVEAETRTDFRLAQAASFASRRMEGQLVQARKVCETLDARDGVVASVRWPPPPQQPAQDEETEEDGEGPVLSQAEAQQAAWEAQPVEAKLADVLDHLRSQHHYCFFCGCQFSSQGEMEEACPGPNEDDH